MIAIGTAAPSDDVPSERDLVGPDENPAPLPPDWQAAIDRANERLSKLRPPE